jgi:hypothetical protein
MALTERNQNNMKKNKAKAGKSAKDKLAAGAAKIRQLQKSKKGKTKKAAPVPLEPVVIPESTRDIKDIIRDRVTVLPGSIGLELDKDTPIEETLRVLDWTTTLSDHVGFMIGDVLNFGETKFGEKYNQAMLQTGRSKTTLKGYAEAAKRIPASQRVAALSFSHHREIIRLGDSEKIATVLKEVGAQAEKGNAPTTKELRFKVQKLTPRKKKKAKQVTSGKGKKGKKAKEVKPYEPTPDEQSQLDIAEEAISEANKAVKEGGVSKILFQVDNKEKHRWLKMLEPFVTFYNNLDRVTGY